MKRVIKLNAYQTNLRKPMFACEIKMSLVARHKGVAPSPICQTKLSKPMFACEMKMSLVARHKGVAPPPICQIRCRWH